MENLELSNGFLCLYCIRLTCFYGLRFTFMEANHPHSNDSERLRIVQNISIYINIQESVHKCIGTKLKTLTLIPMNCICTCDALLA